MGAAQRRSDAEEQTKLDALIDEATAPSPDLRLEAAHAWYELGESARSLKVWEQVLRDKPNDGQRLADAGLTALRGGDARRGAEMLERAVQLEPQRVMARSNLGIALMTVGSVDAALPHFQKAAELAPDDARMHANLALASSLAKRPAEAAAAYRRVLELEPANFAARRDLAWILATSSIASSTTANEACTKPARAANKPNSLILRRSTPSPPPSP
ncbi:MAG: tetratricopeptide repeat protein [Pirellulales bacterium]